MRLSTSFFLSSFLERGFANLRSIIQWNPSLCLLCLQVALSLHSFISGKATYPPCTVDSVIWLAPPIFIFCFISAFFYLRLAAHHVQCTVSFELLIMQFKFSHISLLFSIFANHLTSAFTDQSRVTLCKFVYLHLYLYLYLHLYLYLYVSLFVFSAWTQSSMPIIIWWLPFSNSPGCS